LNSDEYNQAVIVLLPRRLNILCWCKCSRECSRHYYNFIPKNKQQGWCLHKLYPTIISYRNWINNMIIAASVNCFMIILKALWNLHYYLCS